ncbi:MAG: FlgD immunoglobulin-like domain containing protein [Candidatus Krumholzibacteriia bacterium]
MKKHLFGMALTVSVMLIAGLASAQTIDDIQAYDVAGAPASPFVGQSVTLTGTVYVVAGTYNSGTHYITDGTNGIQFFKSGTGLVYGDVIELTGTVSSFAGEIQIGSPSISLLSQGPEATPTAMTIGAIKADYESVGSFVSTIGTIASVSGGDIFMYDGADTLQVYVDSDTGINLGAVAVGDLYQISGPIVNYYGLIEMKPRRQSDLVENPGGDTVPVVQNVTCVDWVQMANEAIEVSASITDDQGVTSATLYYRDNDLDGTSPGTWLSAAMTLDTGSTYIGTIPAPHASDVVEFYVEATDTGAQTTTNPGDAPTGFYTTAVGITPIYAMQYVHPDSASQTSPYNGKFLNIRGIITASPGQAGAVSRIVVQEQNPSSLYGTVNGDFAGTYAYGAVLVYAGAGLDPGAWFQGDLVEIGGRGGEYFGLTEMIPHNNTALYLVDYSQDLPPATRVQTRVLADDVTNGGEAWESVWVQTFTAAVIDTAGSAQYGEYMIADKDSRADSLIVAPEAVLAYVPTLGDVLTVEGYMDYAFGEFRIVPISDEFIVQSAASSVDLPTVEKAGGFHSIAPNPFNPTTKVSFVVNRDNLVQLNVYNIRGEKVRTLIQDRLPANTYEFVFDGKDDAGQALASGTYFARLRIGSEVMQVRKVSLIK